MKIIIPDGTTEVLSVVEYLPAGAKREDVTEVVIPSSVQTIGQSAFAYCTSLKNLTLSEGLESIRQEAFHGCKSLESVVIPESTARIYKRAFWNCKNLKTAKMPENIDMLYTEIFEDCSNLETVNLPQNARTIPMAMFLGCKNLQNIDIPDSVIEISEAAFAGSGLTRVVLPNSVRRLKESAFEDCVNLKEVHTGSVLTKVDITSFINNPQSITFVVPKGSKTEKYMCECLKENPCYFGDLDVKYEEDPQEEGKGQLGAY